MKTSETVAESLPTDLAHCHAIIAEQAATIRVQEREKAALLHRIEQLLRQAYGRRSEKFDPAQLLLFAMEAMEAVAATAPDAQAEAKTEEASTPKKKGHGRRKPPLELPRVPIEHPVADADKVCAECGGEKKRIGVKITEQLEYTPAALIILEHRRPVCACTRCQAGVVVAPKPAHPIEKGLPGPGLLAHVVVSKYGDHLPLYRQEAIFERHGLELSRQTMCGWAMAAAHLLEPVVEAMKRSVLDSKVLHTDDTPVTVREPGTSGTHQGRFWVYLGDGTHPYTVYDYTPSRKRDGPVAFLDGFFGTAQQPRYLQADAFGGYDGIYTPGEDTRVVREVACWAHARRKFYDARTSDVVRSHAMLGWIRELYHVERDAKALDPFQRHALRQEKSKAILAAIEHWLDEQHDRVLPKSAIAEAIQYARNHWAALSRFLDDGDLAIDNNAAENALRAIAIGRKNWMMLGSDRGGRAAATLYSLTQSAKRHALDPFLYLRDLFLRIPTHPNKEIHLLLPDHWKRNLLPTLEIPTRP